MELWSDENWMIHLRNLELPQELAELYAMRAQAKVALGDLVGKPWGNQSCHGLTKSQVSDVVNMVIYTIHIMLMI